MPMPQVAQSQIRLRWLVGILKAYTRNPEQLGRPTDTVNQGYIRGGQSAQLSSSSIVLSKGGRNFTYRFTINPAF
jgi:hypothetical protein